MGMQEDKEGLVEPRASQRPVGGILPTPPLGGKRGTPWAATFQWLQHRLEIGDSCQ